MEKAGIKKNKKREFVKKCHPIMIPIGDQWLISWLQEPCKGLQTEAPIAPPAVEGTEAEAEPAVIEPEPKPEQEIEKMGERKIKLWKKIKNRKKALQKGMDYAIGLEGIRGRSKKAKRKALGKQFEIGCERLADGTWIFEWEPKPEEEPTPEPPKEEEIPDNIDSHLRSLVQSTNKDCVIEATRRTGGFITGKIAGMVTISEKGRVSSFEITNNTTRDSTVTNCIERQVKRWRTPKREKTEKHSVTFIFMEGTD